MNTRLRLFLLFWVFLVGCRVADSALDATVTAVASTATPEIRVVTEFSYALEPREGMIKTADAILAGRVTNISPTQYNQDSGEYWEQTTIEGPGLETIHTALPVFTIELTVDTVWVDEIGLGETAVLTQVGSSPLDDNHDWSIQAGDEIIAFVVQREIAWWDGQPVRAIPYEDGFSFEVGRREVLRFANAPADTYLLRQADGRYASLPGASEPWPPLTLNEFSHEIALFRPVPTDEGVTLQIVTPEPSPTPAICTPLPEDMTFTVTLTSDTPALSDVEVAVALELTGLQPGENLYLMFVQDKPDGEYQAEEWGMAPVGQDGRFSFMADLTSPYEYPDWQIKIIHARGVACTEITLPEEETAVSPSEPLAPQVNCPDPQVDDMVGTFVKNDTDTTYTNPVLGSKIIFQDTLCLTEPQYLFDVYGFYLSDLENWGENVLNVGWLYQSGPDQLEAIVQETIDSYPELDVARETIKVDGIEGVMLWPLPGTEATTQIYLAANGRLYRLIFWSAPLNNQAQTLLDGLRFVEPTQSLDSLNLPGVE